MAERSSVTLRARAGQPLADPRVRDTVAATAHAIGERTGVRVVHVDPHDDRVTITLEGEKIVSVGFAAELRRLTNRWYRDKHGVTLWGDDPTGTEPWNTDEP